METNNSQHLINEAIFHNRQYMEHLNLLLNSSYRLKSNGNTFSIKHGVDTLMSIKSNNGTRLLNHEVIKFGILNQLDILHTLPFQRNDELKGKIKLLNSFKDKFEQYVYAKQSTCKILKKQELLHKSFTI